MNLTNRDYVAYIRKISQRFEGCGEYITALDAATGDGDHWTNINSGFLKLVEMSEELETLSVSDMFKKIGMTLMSVMGGSSGVLYGSAYLEAAKVTKGTDTITLPILKNILEAMLAAIMKRGNVQPGQKTMVDALCPAVEAFSAAIDRNLPEAEIIENMRKAAIKGAESTKDIPAVRGRAFYQANKGVGHLDPGAVTMSYQLDTLGEYILSAL